MQLWRANQGFCDELNLLVPYDPAATLLGVYTNGVNAHINTKTSPSVYSSFLLNCQTFGATKMPAVGE